MTGLICTRQNSPHFTHALLCRMEDVPAQPQLML